MEDLDFILINEELQNYIHAIENSDHHFYIDNLELFLMIAKQLQRATVLKHEESNYRITLLECIDYTTKYLEQLDPNLAKIFTKDISTGRVNFNDSNDDFDSKSDIYDTMRGRNQTYRDNNNVHIIEENNRYTVINQIPKSFINIESAVESYDLIRALTHEFMHTYNRTDLDYTSNFLLFDELVSIYFEFDFMNYMYKQGYPKDLFLNTNIFRYNDIISDILNFIENTKLLLKIKKEGVLDQHSFNLEKMKPNERKLFLDNLHNLNDLVKEREQKRQLNHISLPEDNLIFYYHIYSKYIFGAPLAYYLSKSNDSQMPHKVLNLLKNMNKESLSDSLEHIDLSINDIRHLDFGQIVRNMKMEIIETRIKSNRNNNQSHMKL